MSFRFLADENLNFKIVRGLLRRIPAVDLVTMPDVGLLGADDPTVLAYAAQNGRIVLTHDLATMPKFAYDRLDGGQNMAGLFLIDDNLPIGKVIDEIELIVSASNASEWEGQVRYLPLKY